MTSNSELARATSFAFARHETFHPRYGWLRKAFEAPNNGPDVFSRPDATVLFGVGKNMVHAIRYWGLAYKILAEAPNASHPRRPGVVATEFGRSLLGDDGWDPYLEQPATLWLLHWQLLAAPCMAPVWWVTFNMLELGQTDDNELVNRVLDVIAAVPGWAAVAPGSAKKDVDCLLRMYASRGVRHQGIDDLLDSPFRELGLFDPVPGDPRRYRFSLKEKPTLPDVIVAYAALDFTARTSPGSTTITVARLATEAGSPGRAFRLPAASIVTALERVAAIDRRLQVAAPAGSPQLLIDGDPTALARDLLAGYYQNTTGSPRQAHGTNATKLAPVSGTSSPTLLRTTGGRAVHR